MQAIAYSLHLVYDVGCEVFGDPWSVGVVVHGVAWEDDLYVCVYVCMCVCMYACVC